MHVSRVVPGCGRLLHGRGPDEVRGNIGDIRLPGLACGFDRGLGRATDSGARRVLRRREYLDYFGKEANVGLVASVMQRLTPYEGSALFEANVSPASREGFDELAFCGGLTPELAARALRGIADRVFPSLMWDDLQYHVGLDEWMEGVLGYDIENEGSGFSGPPGSSCWRSKE